MEFPDDLLTVEETAAFAQRSIWTVYIWCSERRIDSWKIRGRRYFSRADVERYIFKFDPARTEPKTEPAE
ncbi:helix-turn-helix domain-containing protein [Rhizobium sp. BK251]|uniref:helix-turn-helix domain-containing protein n=1 Tax=Rhizobium sp. BK251 TaxID=2512125 RepID=UPI00104CBE38|nr:helix-turn-helix domain-containing protein [Rhizobium sp. BK251]TCL65109.1 excisionase family DNA binding protein [Rhizobium sp. BK251]